MAPKTKGSFIFNGDRIVICERKDGSFYLWNVDKKMYLSKLFYSKDNIYQFDDRVSYYLLTINDDGTFQVEFLKEKTTYKENED